MRRFLWVFPIAVIFLFGIFLGGGSRHREALAEICQLVSDSFYRDDNRLKIWTGQCLEAAAGLPARLKLSDFMHVTQALLDRLEVSHLAVYSPSEDREVWRGRALDTGLRTHFVEDALIVKNVIRDSAAARVGVETGDEVVAIEGVEHPSPWGARHRKGWFDFNRRGQNMRVRIEPTDLKIDHAPEVTKGSRGVGVINIPSFRSEYFKAESWRAQVEEARHFSRLVVDLRENAGGNFVAMLRALSPFMCEPIEIGTVDQPRKDLPTLNVIPDEMSDEFQIQTLGQYSQVGLETYSSYGCLPQPVTVLIGAGTQSVAEIFAYAMSLRGKTRVWGNRSAGEVVLAVWYTLPHVGEGFSLSIPEAVFKTLDQKELEGVGVVPSRYLEYDLHEARQGLDSWILRASE